MLRSLAVAVQRRGLTQVLGSGKSNWLFGFLAYRFGCHQFLSQLVFLACGVLLSTFGRGASDSPRSPPARGQQFRKPFGGESRFGNKSLGAALACHFGPLHVSLRLPRSLRGNSFSRIVQPNSSFKPKLLRSGNGVAG